MSISRVKIWNGGDILTANDLNAEFNNIINNGINIWSPATANLNFNGKVVTWDASANTTSSSTQATGMVWLAGSKSGGPGTVGSQFDFANHTFTDTTTASGNTATKYAGTYVHAPTLAASGTGVVTTDAASLYVDGPPVAGAHETLTNAWAAWFGGNVRIDGSVQVPQGTAVFATATNPLPVNVGGTQLQSYTVGDLLYATGPVALSKLSIGSNGQFLKSTGTAPTWSTLSVAAGTLTSTVHQQVITVTDLFGGGTTTSLTVSLGDYAFAPNFTYIMTGTTSGLGTVSGNMVWALNQNDTGNTAGLVNISITASDSSAGVTTGQGILRWRTLI